MCKRGETIFIGMAIICQTNYMLQDEKRKKSAIPANELVSIFKDCEIGQESMKHHEKHT